MNHKRIAFVLAAAFLIFLAGAYFFGDSISGGAVAAAGFLLFALSYVTGLFAVLFSIVFSLLALLASIPVVSTVYGWLIFTFSTIPYRVFNFIFSKTLKRMKWYKNLETKTLNSGIYRRLSSAGDSFLKKLGLTSPMLLAIYPTKKCGACGKKTPADGGYCSYCGKNLK
jgi:hypothetical protein